MTVMLGTGIKHGGFVTHKMPSGPMQANLSRDQN
jgi:hypothetical protein